MSYKIPMLDGNARANQFPPRRQCEIAAEILTVRQSIPLLRNANEDISENKKMGRPFQAAPFRPCNSALKEAARFRS